MNSLFRVIKDGIKCINIPPPQVELRDFIYICIASQRIYVFFYAILITPFRRWGFFTGSNHSLLTLVDAFVSVFSPHLRPSPNKVGE